MEGAPDLTTYIRDVADFPDPGIVFRDITPLLADRDALRAAVDRLAAPFAGDGVDAVAGIEARGFMFGTPVADRLGVGFVPIRKPGKLPMPVHSHTYDLEYGTDTVEMHRDAVPAGSSILIVDDVLATGGTACAAAGLVARAGAAVAGFAFLIELAALEGRRRLGDHRVEVVVPL